MTKLTHFSENNAKIAGVMVFSLIAFAVYEFYCYNTVSEVKVNGPQYQRIAEGDALIADVLPPREYLVETYLTAFEMMDADRAQLPGLVAKTGRLKREYMEGCVYWNAILGDDSLKHVLMEKATQPGYAMLETLENGFIPALAAGDKARAQELLSGIMRRQFKDHRKGVDEVVRLAMERNRQTESSVAEVVRKRTIGQLLIGLILVLLVTGLCLWTIFKCEADLKRLIFGMLIGAVPMSRDLKEKMMWN